MSVEKACGKAVVYGAFRGAPIRRQSCGASPYNSEASLTIWARVWDALSRRAPHWCRESSEETGGDKDICEQHSNN